MSAHLRAALLKPSASDRWFTPSDLLAEIQAFLGDYDDPCPARLPGERIDSGLWVGWRGAVYVNPPYGRAIAPWIRKAVTEPVHELALLVPARTDAAWFQPIWDEMTVCFIRGRLRFSGCTDNAPFPSALCYRGPRHAAFVAAFQRRGVCVRRIMEVTA